MIDILDYRLLRAVTDYQTLPAHSAPSRDRLLAPRGLEDQVAENIHLQTGNDIQPLLNLVIAAYLDGDVSLGRAAKLLHLSTIELRERFNRLGIPLRLGPDTVDEARAEIDALRDLR